MPRTGPRPRARGQRPHLWKTGPDPVRHERFVAWARARAQAHFRGEDWRLTFHDWERAWADQWHRRGRGRDDLMLCRRDWHRPWTSRNVHLLTRRQFRERQRQIKAELKHKSSHG